MIYPGEQTPPGTRPFISEQRGLRVPQLSSFCASLLGGQHLVSVNLAGLTDERIPLTRETTQVGQFPLPVEISAIITIAVVIVIGHDYPFCPLLLFQGLPLKTFSWGTDHIADPPLLLFPGLGVDTHLHAYA